MTATDDLAAQVLAANVRAALSGIATVLEVRMFGGTGFMLNGNLLAAASKRGLLLRVGKERQADALSLPGARPMEMRGRTMEGYVYVDPPALTGDATREWLRLALAFVQTLPPKASGEKPARNARKKGKQT
jgi:TfoX/Sxy family transcriptional regulator of competence genes